MCKTTPSNSTTAPASDNKNYATQAETNTDTLSAFPGTIPTANDTCPSDSDGDEPLPGQDTTIPPGVLIEPSLDLAEPPTTPGAKLTKIRYGPYSIPANGMLENKVQFNIALPCRGCYIVALQAGLEYANGSEANIDSGAWLHHMVLALNGLGKSDTVCGELVPQRSYASRNERAVARANVVAGYGHRVDVPDSVGMVYDLMNMSEQDQVYYITVAKSQPLPSPTPPSPLSPPPS